ncbi:hypothetical protein [Hymenobacter cellulosivorans]|uniref:Cupin domain-containing protein n=1 Tax=Hymenobacter cellulosivorans TaxID=2932249 RepID=A0ABY4F5E8_9BACT|nr:hypothetical protein [Hymenobacter cellulosivorans]UOQ51748.1 hypothetical protein MUN80_18530 [Hymenobacter cellulosivorans]
MSDLLLIPPAEGVRTVGRGESEHFEIANSHFTWKAKGVDTGYAFAIHELPQERGKDVPRHASEVFYILEGQVNFMRLTEDQLNWVTCAQGDPLIVPPNAFRSFANRSGVLARLLSTANQLHQAYFDEAARTVTASDPLPAGPPEMDALQRTLAWAPKYNIFFAPLAAPTA